MVVGCSHGELADQSAIGAVLKFKDRWRPDFTAHLGDFIDAAAFRSGAKGTSDESRKVGPDFSAGVVFLNQLRPNVVLCGNHESRIWKLRGHHSAIVSELAFCIVRDIEKACDKLKARIIPYDYKAHYRLGDCRLMHGTMFGENATRDHAEAYGPCIHAHTHRAGQARGRRVDNPLGICVGTLTKVANMDYAATRRATLGWSQGLAFGYYSDKTTKAWLCERGQDETGEWMFPI